jgi:pimeloyl-ACP methyl ester carboxylesterase
MKAMLARALMAVMLSAPLVSKALEPVGIALENWPYPYPVQFHELTLNGQTLRQAYLDVAPIGRPNGSTALLLHGRNFNSGYWQATIDGLARDGYRVIATDQIGFGKSAKPEGPYSFDQMARNTADLLNHLQIVQVDLVAHSMGGMLAARFTRTYPGMVRRMVLESPIGLEDYRFTVPPVANDVLIRQELAQTADGYFKQLKIGYSLDLPDSAIMPMVELRQRLALGGEFPRWVTSYVASFQMIHDQPVVHEYPLIATPTLFIMGAEDHNAPGRPFAPPELAKTMGFNADNARKIAATMPAARVLVYDGVGHIPHLERPQRFLADLVAFLDTP